MADHEEFNQIFSSLSVAGLQQKVKGLIANNRIDEERFCDLYQLYEHNLASKESKTAAQIPLQLDIIQHIEEKIQEEETSKTGHGNTNGRKNATASKTWEKKPTDSKGTLKHMIAAADVFDSLTQEKKAKVERKRQKQMEEQKENKAAHSNSKAGKSASASKMSVP